MMIDSINICTHTDWARIGTGFKEKPKLRVRFFLGFRVLSKAR
jgi:hypothetical protein